MLAKGGGNPHHHSCGRFSTVLSPVLVAEDSPCWRPCCCWRSCARRPAACACASPSPVPTCCATTSWRWVSVATTTTPVTPPWTAGRLSCSLLSISPFSPPLHPPPRPPLRSPAGKKGLQVRRATASWAGPSSGGRCSATAAAAKGTAGAGWPYPWTSRPTSWMCCSTWPKPNTCAPKRLKTRVCWLTLGAGSEHVTGRLGKQSLYQLTAMTSVGLFSAEKKSLFTLKRIFFFSIGCCFCSFCSHVLFLGSLSCLTPWNQSMMDELKWSISRGFSVKIWTVTSKFVLFSNKSQPRYIEMHPLFSVSCHDQESVHINTL